MSFEIRNVLDNYTAAGHKSNEIRVGVVSPIDNKPQMNWNSLDSWVCSLSVLEEDNTTFTINSLSRSPYIKIMTFNKCVIINTSESIHSKAKSALRGKSRDEIFEFLFVYGQTIHYIPDVRKFLPCWIDTYGDILDGSSAFNIFVKNLEL